MTQTSEEVDQLYSALIDAQAEFASVPKTADNPFYKSKYADLPTIMAVTQPVLAKHGLGVTMPPGRGTIFARLVHRSGQWQESEMDLVSAKADPQGQGSAITYARRYAYCSVLGLITEADDDGNAASAPPKARRQAAPAQTGAGSDAQLRMLGMLFGECAITDRTERLRYVSNVIGRDVESSKELTKAEASKVIDLLTEIKGEPG